MRNKILNNSKLFTILFLFSTPLLAQNSTDMMHSMGKMYVVVATICAIFVGLIIYLAVMDRKLTKLENQIKEKNE